MGIQRLGQAFDSTRSVRNASSRSAADCIGRVGGLAAALGVGAVLFAAPWTAAADTDGSSGKRDSSSTSQAGATDSSDSSSTREKAGTDNSDSADGSGQADESEESENSESSSEAEDLEVEVEVEEDLDEELDDDTSVDDDADATDTGGTEFVDEDEDIIEESGGSDDATPSDTVVPRTASDKPEPFLEPEAVEPVEAAGAPTPDPVLNSETAVVETNSPRSSRASTSTMSARTTDQVTEAPAKALQAQPGAFLEVASSMLTAVIAPLVASPTAPAAPSAQPLMWGVLSWVRRELEETFANFSISIGGRQIVQNGTAFATSEGFGSFAIAHGENAIASASGLFNVAVVRGDDSTATSAGNFTRVRVRGDDNTAGANGPGSRASVYGEQNSAEATGAYATIYVRGVGNEVTGTGVGARATVVGHDNDATALATNGSRADIVIRGDDNSGAASADEDSTARVRILGDGSTAVADADADGYATARIAGDSNVASSDALGETSIAQITGDDSAASASAVEARAEATTYGDVNAAQATDGRAVISGDGGSATADGPGSVARVWGDTSVASALGEDNTAFVWGDESIAIAGPGTDNTAISLGNNLIADTGPGDGNTVYGQPIDPENQAPVAGTPGEQTVDPQTGTVTGNLGFSDPDGDDLTYTATDPANGSVTIDAETGAYTYTPAVRPDFGQPDGADAFTVTASDGQATATTTINVPVAALPEPGNQAPETGQSGPWQINEETGVVTATLGFTDPDGDPLTYTVTDQPDNGIVTVDNAAGTYTYTPATRPEFGEPDETTTFTVVATDPGGLTATNTIGLPIVALPEPDNNAPVAGTPGTPVVDDETGVVTGTLGFTDPDGDTLTYEVTDPPANGNVTINAVAGTYTYTPATRPEAGEPDGTASFTILASDPDGLSASTTIDVPVVALPDPGNTLPVAGDDATTVAEGSTVNVIDVLANDTDADNDTLTVTAVGTAANGTAAVSADGLSVIYTPDADFNGADTFTYTVTDTAGGTDTATVTITVTAVDDPASLGNDTATVTENSTANIIDVLANDSDIDGALTVTAVSTPTHGTAAVSGDGLSVIYTPDADFNGADTFTYTVTDAAGGTGTATVSVTVTASTTNQPPTAEPIFGAPSENGVVTGTLGASDAEDDDLSFTVVDGVESGTLTLNADGTFTYTPTLAGRIKAAQSPGEDVDGFTVQISDGVNAAVVVAVDGLPVSPGTLAETAAVLTDGTPIDGVAGIDGATMYVTNGTDSIVGGGKLKVIDTATNTVTATLDIGGTTDGVAISPDGSVVYVVDADDRTLSLVDTASNTVITTITDLPVNPRKVAVSPDGTRIYLVSNNSSEGFTVIDTSDNSVVTTVDLDARDLAVSPDGSRVYLAQDTAVAVVDTDTNAVIDTILVGSTSFQGGVAVNSDGSRVYATNQDDDTVSVIDTSTNSVVATVTVGSAPANLAISPDDSVVYVPNLEDGTVSVIDTASNTVISTVPVGTLGFGVANVAFLPDGTAYVMNFFESSVFVIGVTDSVTVV